MISLTQSEDLFLRYGRIIMQIFMNLLTLNGVWSQFQCLDNGWPMCYIHKGLWAIRAVQGAEFVGRLGALNINRCII